MKKKVIAYKNLPARGPIGTAVVCWLALDRLRAPGWAWGALGVLLFLWLIGWIMQLATQQLTDIFEDKKVRPADSKGV